MEIEAGQFGELRKRLRGPFGRPLEPDPGNAGGGTEMREERLKLEEKSAIEFCNLAFRWGVST